MDLRHPNTIAGPTRAALALALLALSGSLAQATTTSSGRLLFDLSRPEHADGSIDLTPQHFSSVKATFTVQIMGAFSITPGQLGDYELLSQRRQDWGLPNCASSSQYWCVDEQIVYERSLLSTATQDDAWLRAGIAGAAGRASVADNRTASQLEDRGISLDSSSTGLSIVPFSHEYDADGNVIRTRYSDWHTSIRYQTHSFIQWVYSPLAELSVTLELGAGELARLSEQGQLRFDFGHSMLSYAPTLRLDYVTSAVPEAQTWLQLAGGLVALAGLAARRRARTGCCPP